MQLNEKNRNLKGIFIKVCICFLISLLTNCNPDDEKTLKAKEKIIADSISKVQQKITVDSLKRLNPLLIMPPDSTYTGDYVDKYKNGITKFTGQFRFGKRHGQWMSFYNNGLPWSELHYDKGLRDGINKVYYEDGKLRYTGFYKQDQRDSIWQFFDSIGTLQKTIIYNRDKEVLNK